MKKLFFVLALVTIAMPVMAQIPVQGPIVPCGIGGQGECTLACIPVLLKNLIDYAMFYIAIPIATVMVVVVGLMFILSAGNPGRVSNAKGRLYTLVIGIAIVFVAWVFIDVLIRMLAGGQGFKGAMTSAWSQLPACTTTGNATMGAGAPQQQQQQAVQCPSGAQTTTQAAGGGWRCVPTYGSSCYWPSQLSCSSSCPSTSSCVTP